LVLAGGAVTGGAFKVGGLKALDDYFVGRRVKDFDTYVGLSAGAFLAAALAAGVSPNEMIRVLEGRSRDLEQLRPLDFYHPNWREFVQRPAQFAIRALAYLPATAYDLARALPELPGAVAADARAFLREPNYTNFEALALTLREHVAPNREIPSPADHIPSGLFDNRGLERWLRRNFEKLGTPNDFVGLRAARGRDLYITACDLDRAEREVFGHDENNRVSVSEAVQASTALPLLYRPARIGGVDYVDGGVYRTANIDVAIEKGADLIVCYNPFRPILNTAGDGHLSDWGLKTVLNQSFRTLLHSRLLLGLHRYLLDPEFHGDIVVLEPRERDIDFFNSNPMAFWKRKDAIQQGFVSVRTTIEQNFPVLEEVFARYGIEMSRSQARRKEKRAEKAWGWKPTPPIETTEGSPPTLRVVS
jgi:predicted acylesterase/phospholipase RssA